jgi:hypothetical protein
MAALLQTLTGGLGVKDILDDPLSAILTMNPAAIAARSVFGDNWLMYLMIAGAVGGTIFLVIMLKR